MKIRIFSVAFLLALAACSIKENRDGCPSLLMVDMSGTVTSDNVRLSVLAGTQMISNSVNPSDGQSVFEYEVPRGRCGVFAVEGGEPDSEGKVTVPPGNQFGPVFAYSSYFMVSDDRILRKVTLHKEFATITLDLNDAKWRDDRYHFVIKGQVNGLDMLEQIPCLGDFYYNLPSDGSAYRTVRVPRQADDSLLLILVDGGRTISEIKLGALIKEYGFDWSKEDLDDIMVKVPDLLMDISVSASDWDISDMGDVRI